MRHELNSCFRSVALAATLAWAATAPAQATVFFEALPTSLDMADHTISHHGVGGPILADDFVSAVTGQVTRVEWWGSAAVNGYWELAFHTDNPTLHQPNVDSTYQGAMVKYGAADDLLAFGVEDDPSQPGLFHYVVDLPTALSVTAGTEYWFTVANHGAGWHWAFAFGAPTVGSQNYHAYLSDQGFCEDGGPHCGPWSPTPRDFAFRMNGVPEPATLVLAGLGLAALALSRRPKQAAGTCPH